MVRAAAHPDPGVPRHHADGGPPVLALGLPGRPAADRRPRPARRRLGGRPYVPPRSPYGASTRSANRTCARPSPHREEYVVEDYWERGA
ncbi:hypothetical protein LV779_10375 [Streptomyces thinghirensis]|nr:hypothetical protein [Streptomyces thinghirensis]